jgi:hypothetical protein
MAFVTSLVNVKTCAGTTPTVAVLPAVPRSDTLSVDFTSAAGTSAAVAWAARAAAKAVAESVTPVFAKRARSLSRPRSKRPLTMPAVQPSSLAVSSCVLPSK